MLNHRRALSTLTVLSRASGVWPSRCPAPNWAPARVKHATLVAGGSVRRAADGFFTAARNRQLRLAGNIPPAHRTRLGLRDTHLREPCHPTALGGAPHERALGVVTSASLSARSGAYRRERGTLEAISSHVELDDSQARAREPVICASRKCWHNAAADVSIRPPVDLCAPRRLHRCRGGEALIVHHHASTERVAVEAPPIPGETFARRVGRRRPAHHCSSASTAPLGTRQFSKISSVNAAGSLGGELCEQLGPSPQPSESTVIGTAADAHAAMDGSTIARTGVDDRSCAEPFPVRAGRDPRAGHSSPVSRETSRVLARA
ncbi:hypothetical protein FB391_3829 [Microbacterium kyungheense]|uniref:Uncharacterized protein n=1 Tax=Microbacterium kyungheense TaxID=1263636 RepID=A0A543EAS4_9MICO|nr:hypothetical protein FB391_3829 [Microbacterium kyungheense]